MDRNMIYVPSYVFAVVKWADGFSGVPKNHRPKYDIYIWIWGNTTSHYLRKLSDILYYMKVCLFKPSICFVSCKTYIFSSSEMYPDYLRIASLFSETGLNKPSPGNTYLINQVNDLVIITLLRNFIINLWKENPM